MIEQKTYELDHPQSREKIIRAKNDVGKNSMDSGMLMCIIYIYSIYIYIYYIYLYVQIHIQCHYTDIFSRNCDSQCLQPVLFFLCAMTIQVFPDVPP